MSNLIGSPGIQLPNADSGHIFLNDTCVDTDGVPLQDHDIPTTDGARDYVWVQENIKTRYIANNKIALTGLVDPDGKENDYSLNMGERFLTVEAKMQSLSTGFSHIMTLKIRDVDIDNYIGLRWQQFHPIITNVELVKSVSGLVTPISAAITTDNGYQQTEQIMKLEDDGENITCYFADETPIIVATDLFNYTPKIGIKNTFDPLATVRDVIVSKT